MSHWHLTIGETAFFTPFGVVLGAVVSYVAVRRSTAATLEIQKAAIAETHVQAAEQRQADLDREERDHRRAAYTELGGHLQSVSDALNYVVGPVLLTSSAPQPDWVTTSEANGWGGFYAQIMDTVPSCRRLASVYGSPEVRGATGALSALVRVLAPPSAFADSSGHWMHELDQRDGGIASCLKTLQDGNELRATMLDNIRIVQEIVRYGLAQIRYELLPSSINPPVRPEGVASDPDVAAYAVVRREPVPNDQAGTRE